MDLLQTVRKEGSRGGVNFSWDDVKSSSHRENYLGHSLMAPVGRWQQKKDLSWYAKADEADLTPEERAEKERERKREEMRKVKEAEEDAMARALGLPVPDRTNANIEPLGESKISQSEINKALNEALDDRGEHVERGVGFGRHGSATKDDRKEVMKGSRHRDGHRRDRSRSRDRRRDHEEEDRSSTRRRRSRSTSRDRDRKHRHRRYRSRSPSRDRKHRSRSRDGRKDVRSRRYRDERRSSRDRDTRRERSRSPYEDHRRRRETR